MTPLVEAYRAGMVLGALFGAGGVGLLWLAASGYRRRHARDRWLALADLHREERR